MKYVKVVICLLVLVLFVTGCTFPFKNYIKRKQRQIHEEIRNNSKEQKEKETEKTEEKENTKEKETTKERKDAICKQEYSQENIKGLSTTYIEFNTKDKYATRLTNNMKFNYNITLTDDVFKIAVNGIVPNACDEHDCTKKEVDLGETSYGLDTVIKREGNSIMMSYYKNIGYGTTLDEEDKQVLIDSFINQGYTCE